MKKKKSRKKTLKNILRFIPLFFGAWTFPEILLFFIYSYLYIHFLTEQTIDKFVSALAASSIYQKDRKLSFCFPALANFDALSVLGKGNWILYDFRVFNAASSLLEQEKIKKIIYTFFVTGFFLLPTTG